LEWPGDLNMKWLIVEDGGGDAAEDGPVKFASL
jgi:hypothetical protein